MKKVLKSIAITGLALGFAASVQAADSVQVTLTSPTVTGGGCEKIGAVTFDFDAGTILQEGDWFYMDLGSSATFCKSLDYMLVGTTRADNATDFVSHNPLAAVGDGVIVGNDNAMFEATGFILPIDAATVVAIPANGSVNVGPYTGKDTSGVAGGAALAVANQGVALHVTATANANRLMIKVLGADLLPADNDVDAIQVAAGKVFSVTLGDGKALTTELLLDTVTDLDPTDVEPLEEWGSDSDDTIDAAGNAVPHVENTFCASNIDANLYTSFASLNDFLTFTGDSQIAHMASNAITLETCDKETLYIEIGEQNQCEFDYSGNGDGYCDNNFAGSKVYFQASSTLGDPGDAYDVSITSDTNGVYFSAAANVNGFLVTEVPCNDNGTLAIATNEFENVGNTSDVAWPGNTCSIESKRRVNRIYTEGGDITGIHNYDAMEIALPDMYYDTSIIGDGVESDITITFDKYPCGTIFSDTFTIGTFMTTCPTSAVEGTTMLYPFLPAMDGSNIGWWGGFTVVNGSTVAGTCALTYTEADGDTGTYTTASVAAGSQVNGPALADITPGAGNSGTFGDDNVAVEAVCTFNMAGGFAFTGNGTEGTGYTAYVDNGWQ